MNEARDSKVIPFPLRERYEPPEQKIERLEYENKQLREDLALERSERYNQTKRIEELEAKIVELETNPPKRHRRTKAEIEAAETAAPYSEFKSDGKRKAHPADPIRSYEDFKAIQNYFLKKKDVRNWALWTIGVSLGLRISDLLSLRVGNLINADHTFKERIRIIEQKTSKANNCLITPSVKDAATKLFKSINWQVNLDDFLFMSNKTKGKMTEEYGWKILSDAGKALNLPITIGSHTMRKSFANIAACVDKSSIDMNAITKIQGLLNHSDQRVTMRYLGTYQAMFDKAREAVSDFCLGKTDVHELVAGNNFTIDDVVSKLDQLEKKLSE